MGNLTSPTGDRAEGVWISAVATTEGLNRALFTQYSKELNSTEQYNMTQNSTALKTKPHQTVQRVPACRFTGLGRWGGGVIGKKKRSCETDRHFSSSATKHTHTHTHTLIQKEGEQEKKKERENERRIHRHIFCLLYKEISPMAYLVISQT